MEMAQEPIPLDQTRRRKLIKPKEEIRLAKVIVMDTARNENSVVLRTVKRLARKEEELLKYIITITHGNPLVHPPIYDASEEGAIPIDEF
jgi:hypothetical protein